MSYFHYFRLQDPPFSNIADPRCFFESPSHSKTLSNLIEFVGKETGGVLLSGAAGSGKTLLCRCLLSKLPDHVDIALILNPAEKSVELLRTICDELRVRYLATSNEISEIISSLKQYLRANNAENIKTVVVIDEADGLNDETLQLIHSLINIEANGKKLIDVILAGQPSLTALLKRKDLNWMRRYFKTELKLDPLSKADAKAYLHHRISYAGGKLDGLFTAESTDEIVRLCKGSPRDINLLCNKALINAFVHNRGIVDMETMRKVESDLVLATKTNGSNNNRDAHRSPGLLNEAAFASENIDDSDELVDEELFSEKIEYSQTESIDISTQALLDRCVIAGEYYDRYLIPYKILRTRVLQKMTGNGDKTLAVTSPSRGAGTTLTAINLAISTALSFDHTVMLIDLNLSHPYLHRYFDLNPRFGITDYLSKDIPLSSLLINPGIDRLVILPVGKAIQSSSELLCGQHMVNFVQEIKERYEDRIIIFDLPPLLFGDDTLAFLPLVDSILLVLEDGVTTKKEIMKALELVKDKNLIGTVLNKSTEAAPSSLI